MLPKKLFFDLHVQGRVTKNFYLDRILVKSVATSKSGPPMYFKKEHYPITNHLIISQWIRVKKIKFDRYRKLELEFEPATDAEAYFDKTSKTLSFRGEALKKTSDDVGPSSSASSASSRVGRTVQFSRSAVPGYPHGTAYFRTGYPDLAKINKLAFLTL